MYLRKINVEDKDRLLLWRNDSVVRQNSFHSAEISAKEHNDWFNRVIENPEIQIYIAEEPKGEPVGVIRFEYLKTNWAKVHIMVAPSSRGQGYGATMIKNGLILLLNEGRTLEYIQADILRNNTASQRAFIKAGFELNQLESAEKHLSYIYKIK